MVQASRDQGIEASSEGGPASPPPRADATSASSRADAAGLPGLGLVLALLALGIVWAAVGFAQRVHVDDVAAASHVALPDMRIDVNSATDAELTLLPGIGPRLAERIVLDREEHGPFATLSDMTRVTWIGPVIVQRIEPYAFVGE